MTTPGSVSDTPPEVCVIFAEVSLELDAQVRALEEVADDYRRRRDSLDRFLSKVSDAGGWDYNGWLEDQVGAEHNVRVMLETIEPVRPMTVVQNIHVEKAPQIADLRDALRAELHSEARARAEMIP